MRSEAGQERRNGRIWTCRAGFSVFELLIVLVLISLIAAWAVPALIPSMQSKSLTATADEFEQELKGARQVAMSEDVVVDVEFIRITREASGDARFVGYALWKWLPNGERRQVGKTGWLKGDFIFSEPHSTILREGGSGRDTRVLPGLRKQAEIIRFSFFSNGETDLPARRDPDNWHVTICSQLAGDALPNNFATFRINQANGHVTTFRP